MLFIYIYIYIYIYMHICLLFGFCHFFFWGGAPGRFETRNSQSLAGQVIPSQPVSEGLNAERGLPWCLRFGRMNRRAKGTVGVSIVANSMVPSPILRKKLYHRIPQVDLNMILVIV